MLLLRLHLELPVLLLLLLVLLLPLTGARNNITIRSVVPDATLV